MRFMHAMDGREFIATRPGDELAFLQKSFHSSSEHTQDFVAGAVAAQVVDLLEAIEVDANQGEFAIAVAGKLPVVLFTAGGIATPADAAMMMQLGAEGVFVGSGIFKAGNPAQRAAAIVKATTFFDDPDVIANVSRGLGEAMVGINVADLPVPHRLAERGW